MKLFRGLKKILSSKSKDVIAFQETRLAYWDRFFELTEKPLHPLKWVWPTITSLCTRNTKPEPPSAPGHALLGNLPELWNMGAFKLVTRYNQRYGNDGVCTLRLGPKTIYFISDGDLAMNLMKDTAAFPRGASLSPWRDFSANGLSEDALGKTGRVQVVNIVGPLDLHHYFDRMVQNAKDVIKRWKAFHLSEKPICLNEETPRITLSQVGYTIFNTDVFNLSFQNEERCRLFISSFDTLFHIITKRILSPLPDFLYWKWNKEDYTAFEKAKKNLAESLLQIFKDYFGGDPISPESHQHKVLTMFDIDPKNPNLPNLLNTSVGFFQAAFETSSAFLFWTVYELAVHPDIQRDLAEQISHAFGEGLPKNKKDLERVPMLFQVTEEAMRLHPPLPVLIRDVANPSAFEKYNSQYRLKKNATLAVSPYLIQHNEKIWGADASEFKPGRWSNEMTADKWQREFAGYFTFIKGPHQCPGRYFAKQEVQILIALILQHFEIALTSQEAVHPQIHITLKTEKPVYLSLKPRS